MVRRKDTFWYDPAAGQAKSRADVVADVNLLQGPATFEAEVPYQTVVRLLHALSSGRATDLVNTHGASAADEDRSRSLGTSAASAKADIRDWDDLLRRIRLCADQSTVGLLTSGTTGKPKRVMHSFRTLSRGVRSTPRHASATWALAYEPTHLAGVHVILQALATDSPLVYVYALGNAAFFDVMETCSISHISATPTFYRRLLFSEIRPLPAVRVVTCGGEPLDGRLAGQLRSVFPSARVKNIYALSEAGSLFATDGEVFSIPSSLADKIDVAANGELLIHRSLLAEFDADLDGDWYRTGDMVERMPGGRFRVSGRTAELINIAGRKVDVREVERAILEVEGVGDVLVRGRPNRVTGHILEARVVLRPNAVGTRMEQLIVEHLRGRLAPFMIPRIFRFVAELELTQTGKKGRS